MFHESRPSEILFSKKRSIVDRLEGNRCSVNTNVQKASFLAIGKYKQSDISQRLSVRIPFHTGRQCGLYGVSLSRFGSKSFESQRLLQQISLVKLVRNHIRIMSVKIKSNKDTVRKKKTKSNSGYLKKNQKGKMASFQ